MCLISLLSCLISNRITYPWNVRVGTYHSVSILSVNTVSACRKSGYNSTSVQFSGITVQCSTAAQHSTAQHSKAQHPTLVINPSNHQHLSTTPIINTYQPHLSSTPINHTYHQHLSTTHIINTYHQHLSSTPINHTYQPHWSTTLIWR